MKIAYYPTKGWKKENHEKHGISTEVINTLNNIIREDFLHLQSVLIVKNGSIVYEKYLKGYSENFTSYADKNLFSPLGIKDYLWNTNFYEGECLLMKTRDIAKLGYLYLNHGLWENQQLISPEYIQESTSEHIHANFPESNPYGYLWWITNIEKHNVFYAGGFGGQGLYTIPDLQLILVITSNMDKPHTENKMLVKEFVKMITSDDKKVSSRDVCRKNRIKLTREEQKKLLNDIQLFFREERDEEIGIIAAETVMEFFLENLGTYIYNKSLDETKIWFSKRMEDVEVDFDNLYK